jgi:hypothetical protein
VIQEDLKAFLAQAAQARTVKEEPQGGRTPDDPEGGQ